MVHTIESVHFLIYPTSTPTTEPSDGHQSYDQAQASQRLGSVIKCIRNVPKQFSGITPDYVSRATCVPFPLSFSVLAYSSHLRTAYVPLLEVSSSPPRVRLP